MQLWFSSGKQNISTYTLYKILSLKRRLTSYTMLLPTPEYPLLGNASSSRTSFSNHPSHRPSRWLRRLQYSSIGLISIHTHSLPDSNSVWICPLQSVLRHADITWVQYSVSYRMLFSCSIIISTVPLSRRYKRSEINIVQYQMTVYIIPQVDVQNLSLSRGCSWRIKYANDLKITVACMVRETHRYNWQSRKASGAYCINEMKNQQSP